MTRLSWLVVLVALIACAGEAEPTEDASADAAAAVDVGVDAGVLPDASVDAAIEDAAPDVPEVLDAEADAPVAQDVGPDAPIDAAMDAPIDAATDAGPQDASQFDVGDAAACGTRVYEEAPIASPHVMQCSDIDYAGMPPTSGPHYPIWADFVTYSVPVPWGFLVHAMEHGAVVMVYNCPDGCESELSALRNLLDLVPDDPACGPTVGNRFIVAPDPELDVRFAAAAWGWGLRSNCFDLDALSQFIDEHYAMGPEDVCAQGTAAPACP